MRIIIFLRVGLFIGILLMLFGCCCFCWFMFQSRVCDENVIFGVLRVVCFGYFSLFLNLGFVVLRFRIVFLFFLFYGILCLVLNGFLFRFFVVFYLFFGMNVFCWGGYFVFFDSYIYLLLVFMSFFILGLVLMRECNGVLVFLSEVLVLFCLFFFFSLNMMMLYVFFELSVFPMLVMILGYGFQVEKVRASYYLGFYTVLCSSPFLYVYFCSSFFLFYAYFDFLVSYEMLLFLTFCFLVKFPVYFFHL